MTAPIDKATEAAFDALAPWREMSKKPGHGAADEVARAVFASIDTDELARVLWPYPYPFEAALREHQEFYEGKAEAVKAHLLKEDT